MQHREPTPDSTPPTPALVLETTAERYSISAEINIATRKQHTELNRLIVQRLPLALPRRSWTTDDPVLLARGIAAFAPIYLEFESAWRAVEEAEKIADGTTIAWLAALRPKGLERTPRLRADLERLAMATGVRTDAARSEPAPNRRLVESPHILLAYAWIMYMAIFSGGRWIRQQLVDARPGHELAFLSFDGDEDGEDIKREFKARLTRVEELLSPWERQEVVEEAQRLFERCIALVHELDRQAERYELLHRWLRQLGRSVSDLRSVDIYFGRFCTGFHLTWVRAYQIHRLMKHFSAIDPNTKTKAALEFDIVWATSTIPSAFEALQVEDMEDGDPDDIKFQLAINTGEVEETVRRIDEALERQQLLFSGGSGKIFVPEFSFQNLSSAMLKLTELIRS